MENSHIEWTDNTFNPWWGCMKVSDGCKNCYAETLDNRWQGGHWGPDSPRKAMSEAYWNKPLQWEKQAINEGRKLKVFCASMADVFEDHEQVRLYRLRLFELIAITPNLTWQLLTKRPENIMRFISDCFKNLSFHHPAYHMLGAWVNGTAPDNVWIGTSVENQKAADERIPHLLYVPAKVRFLSCEPLLGPVNIPTKYKTRWGTEFKIDWIIAGGESGPGARPMHPGWITSLIRHCSSAKIPFFFKQWGEFKHGFNGGDNINNAGMVLSDGRLITGNDVIPKGFDAELMTKVGKKIAGSLVNGKEYKQFPSIN